jgi:hypothetical protein
VDIAGGVGIRVYDGEDGSQFPNHTLIGVARSEPCDDSQAADGKNRCLPSNAANVYGFFDSACTMPAAHASPSCDPFYSAKAVVYQDPALDGGARVYDLGAKHATNEMWTKNEPSCDGPGTSEDLHDFGAEIPAATFPETSKKEHGGTRLVSERVFAAGVVMPRWSGYHDLQLDNRCGPTTASDGKVRCLPQGASIAYSDDQCTVPFIFTESTAVTKYAVRMDNSCPQRHSLYSFGAEITPPATVYGNFGGPCVQTNISGNAKTYATGPEVPPSTFVEITEVVP